mmetsp:Transcript_3858/g.13595  ORF Transcript_3858/g.13595 Transcript_3858/m.13595 type:complete len:302 (-) Transcript_3858:208-1113(-)
MALFGRSCKRRFRLRTELVALEPQLQSAGAGGERIHESRTAVNANVVVIEVKLHERRVRVQHPRLCNCRRPGIAYSVVPYVEEREVREQCCQTRHRTRPVRSKRIAMQNELSDEFARLHESRSESNCGGRSQTIAMQTERPYLVAPVLFTQHRLRKRARTLVSEAAVRERAQRLLSSAPAKERVCCGDARHRSRRTRRQLLREMHAREVRGHPVLHHPCEGGGGSGSDAAPAEVERSQSRRCARESLRKRLPPSVLVELPSLQRHQTLVARGEHLIKNPHAIAMQRSRQCFGRISLHEQLR